MRAQEWKGLITDASPYALPPGASVEQLNLQAHIPGQLTTRPGMRRLSGNALLDMYPYAVGGAGGLRYLIGINSSGELRAQTYALSSQLAAPVIPPVTPSPNQIRSNYAGDFQAAGGDAPAIPYTVPAAPTITRASNSETAAWTTPANGGAVLSGYTLYENGVVVESGAWSTNSINDSFTIGALLEVSATNAAGAGPKSAPAVVQEV